MAVALRLKRLGRRHSPVYRLAAMDRKTKRNGRVIEEFGFFDPTNDNEASLTINAERARYWLSVGAIPSQTVKTLLRRQGIEVGSKKSG